MCTNPEKDLSNTKPHLYEEEMIVKRRYYNSKHKEKTLKMDLDECASNPNLPIAQHRNYEEGENEKDVPIS